MMDMVSLSFCVLLLKSQISSTLYSNPRQVQNVSRLEFNKERCGLLRSHRSDLNSQESIRDGLILYGGHVQKRWCNGKSTEEKGTRKPNLYASRVRTSAIRI